MVCISLNLVIFFLSLLTLHHIVGIKCGLVSEISTCLWHKRLGHISKERLERLVNNEILPELDFTDLSICIDFIKGKQTKHTKKGATRSTKLLEIIYIDICGPFDVSFFSGESILSLSLMNFHAMSMSICCMKNLNRWMP
ncbi:hypothetical protein UlMin_012178 [Ulmus minor]